MIPLPEGKIIEILSPETSDKLQLITQASQKWSNILASASDVTNTLGGLSTRVFEMRTATGKEHFTCQDSGVFQIFVLIISNGEKILSNVNVVVCKQVKRENSSLPVAVHVAKTYLIKLPIRSQTSFHAAMNWNITTSNLHRFRWISCCSFFFLLH